MPKVTFPILADAADDATTPVKDLPQETTQTVEVEPNVRLINVLREHLDIGHRCGGKGKCTTCRVHYESGEPERMTVAEREKLEAADLLGKVRLSCQTVVEGDTEVVALMRQATAGWDSTGPAPAEEIEPEPEWVPFDPAGS